MLLHNGVQPRDRQQYNRLASIARVACQDEQYTSPSDLLQLSLLIPQPHITSYSGLSPLLKLLLLYSDVSYVWTLEYSGIIVMQLHNYVFPFFHCTLCSHLDHFTCEYVLYEAFFCYYRADIYTCTLLSLVEVDRENLGKLH